MAELILNSIRERDMDLMFAKCLLSDKNFAQLFLSKTKYNGKSFSVIGVELSNIEKYLGESDITVIFEIENKKVAFLIEDKIDAVAMPEQHSRYIKRGNAAQKRGNFDSFEVFILCPEKYYNSNDEAKKYEHFVFYEECIKYFSLKNDALSKANFQQVFQALENSKSSAETTVDKRVNAFLRKYIAFQRLNYPSLDIRTSEESNGYWIHFSTRFGKAYIYHKTQEGYVDLTLPNASTGMISVENLAQWLRKHGVNVSAEKTGKAGALRIMVPKLKISESFENTDREDIVECLEAVSELADFANILETALSVRDIKKK